MRAYQTLPDLYQRIFSNNICTPQSLKASCTPRYQYQRASHHLYDETKELQLGFTLFSHNTQTQ